MNLLTELLPGLLLGAASLTLALGLGGRRADVSDPQRLRILIGLAAAGGALWILAAASRIPIISMGAAGPALVLAATAFTVATGVTLWRLLPELEQRSRLASLQARNAEMEQEIRELGVRIDNLGTLAGGVAHDFNNLLTVIAGHTDLLRRSEHPDQREESLQALEAATERAEALCRRMLAYSGRGHFLLSPTRLVDCIQVDPEAAEEAGIHLELELEEDLPPIDAAPDQVRQMATELIANAVEAAREADLGLGEVHVSATRTGLDAATLAGAVYPHGLEPGDAVVLEVVDTGPGMSAEVRSRLFEPWFSTRFIGRGLGMAAVAGIARGHHAALFVDTTEGSGTSVRVAFPVGTGSRPQRQRAEARVGRVLILDDEPALLRLGAEYCRHLGIDAITTEDPDEAIEILLTAGSDIDAVVLDYLMPLRTGDEVLREIRGFSAVDVYLTSGFSRGEIHDPDLHAELAGFIPKPFRLEDFAGLFRPDPG
jgi:signal transduction histidine kinase